MSGGNGPATIIIHVSRKGQSTNLSLKLGSSQPGQPGDPGDDTLVADVVANQTIKWELDPSPDPGRNTEITLKHVKAADSSKPQYKNSQQLLVDAEYTAVNGVITGTIKANPPAPKPDQGPGAKSFENSQIGFYLNSDPTQTEVWDDPRLRMR